MYSLTCHKVQDAVSEDERSKGGKSRFVYYASGYGGQIIMMIPKFDMWLSSPPARPVNRKTVKIRLA